MLLDTKQSLEEKIVLHLAKKPHASVRWIQERLSNVDQENCTVQGIYRVLRQLQSRGVVTKVGREYKIALPWIYSLRSFSQSLENTYSSHLELEHLLPEHCDSREWNFSNLHSLDDFWDDLTLTLVALAPSTTVYEWLPHSWYSLTAPKKSSRRAQTLSELNTNCYSFLGGDTALDRASALHRNTTHSKCIFVEDGASFYRTTYISVLDPFVVTVTISEEDAHSLDSFYSSARDSSEETRIRLHKLVYSLGGGTLKLERNPCNLPGFLRGFQQILEQISQHS